MRISARSTGSSSGFTLLEVILAAVILATSVVAVVTIYTRSTERAADARDLSVATSTARNAVEEAFADAVDLEEGEEGLSGVIPERPSLILAYRESGFEVAPEGEESALPLTNDFFVEVSRGAEQVVSVASKKAIYLESSGGEAGPAEGGGEADHE